MLVLCWFSAVAVLLQYCFSVASVQMLVQLRFSGGAVIGQWRWLSARLALVLLHLGAGSGLARCLFNVI